jgi:hypothetical protein
MEDSTGYWVIAGLVGFIAGMTYLIFVKNAPKKKTPAPKSGAGYMGLKDSEKPIK